MSFPADVNRKLNLKQTKTYFLFHYWEKKKEMSDIFWLFFEGKQPNFFQKFVWGLFFLGGGVVRWIIRILPGENKTSSFKSMTVIQPLSAAAAYPLHRRRGLESSPADTGPASRLQQIWVRGQRTFTLVRSPAGKRELQINHIWILRSRSKRKAEITQYPADLTYYWYFCTIMHIVAAACKYHFPPLASFASRSLLSSFLSPHRGVRKTSSHTWTHSHTSHTRVDGGVREPCRDWCLHWNLMSPYPSQPNLYISSGCFFHFTGK